MYVNKYFCYDKALKFKSNSATQFQIKCLLMYGTFNTVIYFQNKNLTNTNCFYLTRHKNCFYHLRQFK